MNTDLSKLEKLINEELKTDDIIVDDIGFFKEGKYLFLKITLDRNGGIDLDAIVDASKRINVLIDNFDVKEKDYILDISSKERNGK